MTTDADNLGVDDDAGSEASSAFNNGSIVSTVPDRYGFFGGAQYSKEYVALVSNEVVLRREKKWLTMFNNWEEYMTWYYKKLRFRCRKGIPSSVRPRAWHFLSGANLLAKQSPGLFAKLCGQEGESRYVSEILIDLHRQFPYHEMFASPDGAGQHNLQQVLKCYSILNKEDGYCQAQAPIAAMLLMHMPAEDAFWCLVSISTNYVPGYYNKEMECIKQDGEMLIRLLQTISPKVYRHLKKQEIEPLMFMTEWFLCLFTRSLPWPTMLHLFDIFMCEGMKILFKAGLVLLRSLEGRLSRLPTSFDTLQALRNPLPEVVEEKNFISKVLRLHLTEEELCHQHARIVRMHTLKT